MRVPRKPSAISAPCCAANAGRVGTPSPSRASPPTRPQSRPTSPSAIKGMRSYAGRRRRAAPVAAAGVDGTVAGALMSVLGGAEGCDAQLWLHERQQPGGRDRRAELGQRALHQPEVDAADEVLPFLREL